MKALGTFSTVPHNVLLTRYKTYVKAFLATLPALDCLFSKNMCSNTRHLAYNRLCIE